MRMVISIIDVTAADIAAIKVTVMLTSTHKYVVVQMWQSLSFSKTDMY